MSYSEHDYKRPNAITHVKNLLKNAMEEIENVKDYNI